MIHRNGRDWWLALPDHLEDVAVIGIGIGVVALVVWVFAGAL